MRRKQIKTGNRKQKTGNAIRDSPKELMVEKIQKKGSEFTQEQIQTTIRRRNELEKQGKTDKQISRIIAEEISRPLNSVYAKIRKLVQAEKLQENKNKQERGKFTPKDKAYIIKRIKELSAQGTSDRQMAKEIAKQKGWNAGTLSTLIYTLRKKKQIEENPNKREKREFNAEDISFIKQRWIELSVQGMNDKQIAENIAEEKRWNAGSVESIIRRLRKNKEIGENPNKQTKTEFGVEGIDFIKNKWIEYSALGMNDAQISRIIAEEKHWNVRSVIGVIRRLRKNKEIEKNPNILEKRFFSKEEKVYIKQRWAELSEKGINDQQIAKEIAKQKGWNVGTLLVFIYRLRKRNEFGENPNKQKKRKFSNEEINLIKQNWLELSENGLKDWPIAKEIAMANGRNANSVLGIVYKLRKNKEIGENPNKVDRKPTQNDLLAGLSQAAEAMEKFGERR